MPASGFGLGRPPRQFLPESGQHPFASIVSCIDSRTAVEHVFGFGLGDDRPTIDLIGGFYDPETGKVKFYRPLVGAAPTPAPASAPVAIPSPVADSATPAAPVKFAH